GPIRRDAGPPRSPPPSPDIERWANQLANELDHLQEDLYYERGNNMPTLTREADEASRAVAHFLEVVSRGADQQHLMRDFQEMDGRVHQLVNRLHQSRDNWLIRQAARIQYADEQLHYALRIRPDGGPTGEYREVLARHAHLLESEARQLEQLVQRIERRDGHGANLSQAVRDFASEAEHFHEVVEKGADRKHLVDDFQNVDQAWRRAASQVNSSPYGLYLRRVAHRTNQVHNQIVDLLNQGEPRDQQRPHTADRPRIEYEIPGIGRFQIR
ncbi:MAG: hypothetical protein KJZ87_07540, partial [Thermoguttaceae bacterium]|nr:hypothetical protein [Thermoguttaceae bacterium]